jgi:hypothetical protein
VSVPIRPHTFTLYTESPSLDANNVITGYTASVGISATGCAQWLSPQAAYDAFAREVTNGWAFYLDPTSTNKTNSTVGGKVGYDGKYFAIEKVQINEQGLPTDHIALFAVEERH